ncbi:putative homoserine kinase [Candidatus Omnitrophus magneticus]|uniref:Putative homoserine kinase n=1 Tax=Candidatus Omnitrophus magneticus TaxID=1609969 RepID=A0A0F0CUA4_9BACT|nr:putative homoserine kinase [Candidatus Omnitrophus magneticus]
MKYAILVPDGMADTPLQELDGKTCLEAAVTVNMDKIAKLGIVGVTRNVPRGMSPASDVANLSILGYDPSKFYCGRGPLEAANLGVELGALDVAFRFNTVTINDGKMADYSAGHISSQESALIVKLLNRDIGSNRYHFYRGTSYRNLLVITCANLEEARKLEKVKCFPPHDITGQPINKYLPEEKELFEIMKKSQEILGDNDMNKVRIDLGQNPANMIWIWGQGRKPEMPKFKSLYGKEGGIISAVDLIKGIGRIIGLSVIDVPGATGYYDTNYSGKADAAIKVLEEKDFVFLHVEAPDEAGHNGDILEKIKAIENFDKKIVGPIFDFLSTVDRYRILVLPDHPTPVKKKTHTSDAVPFVMAGTGIVPDEVALFTEASSKAGSVSLQHGHELMKKFLG